jgi:WD40 repeat protein
MLIWQAHKGKIESAAFSPDGKFLATATGGTTAPYLWEPTSGKLIRRPEGASGKIKSVCFAPHAPLFAAGTDESVTVWRTDTWTVTGELKIEYAYELAFGPGESPVLAASNMDIVGVWNDGGRETAGARREADHKYSGPSGVAALHFSPDGGLLAMSNKHIAQIWHAGTLKRTRLIRSATTNNHGTVRFSPDGQRLAIAYSKWVEVWPVAGEEGPLLTFAAGTGRSPIIWAVHWTADGHSLLTAGNDGCVRMWDANAGTELKAFDWKLGKLYCAAFSPDGLTCAACSEKGQVVVWDVDA